MIEIGEVQGADGLGEGRCRGHVLKWTLQGAPHIRNVQGKAHTAIRVEKCLMLKRCEFDFWEFQWSGFIWAVWQLLRATVRAAPPGEIHLLSTHFSSIFNTVYWIFPLLSNPFRSLSPKHIFHFFRHPSYPDKVSAPSNASAPTWTRWPMFPLVMAEHRVASGKHESSVKSLNNVKGKTWVTEHQIKSQVS